MIDFEDRLRSELRTASDQRPVPAAMAQLVDERISRRQRRARARRGAVVITCFAVALASVLAIARLPGDSDRIRGTSLANATPRDGSPGWATLAEAPLSPRSQHASVNVDGEVLVFGGYEASGAAIYNPANGRWRPAADPPGDMGSPVAVWTGDVVLAIDVEGRLYSYDPVSDVWSQRARSPFPGSSDAVTSAVWTGDTLLAVNTTHDGPPMAEPRTASYDPLTDTWTTHSTDPVTLAPFSEAVWSGTELFVHDEGQSTTGLPSPRLHTFTPSDGWEEVPQPPLQNMQHRTLSFMVWTGRELIVGGGATWTDDAAELHAEAIELNRAPTPEDRDRMAAVPASDAAAWNPQTQTWRKLPDAPVPTTGLPRYEEIWTGHEVLVWETDDTGALTGRLALLDPTTNTWRISAAAPNGFPVEAPVTWTGHELVTVGGELPSRATDPYEAQLTTSTLTISFTP